MAKIRSHTIINRSAPGRILQTGAFAFLTGAMGSFVGIVAALAVVLPAVHHDLAVQSQQFGSRLAEVATAAPFDDNSACVQAAGAGAGGQVLGTAISAGQSTVPGQVASGAGSKNNVVTKTFINKLIGGQMTTTTAMISNTGPESTNKILSVNKTTTKVTNNTNISASVENNQQASTGDAGVKENTSGGAAATGDATNTNSTSLTFSVSN